MVKAKMRTGNSLFLVHGQCRIVMGHLLWLNTFDLAKGHGSIGAPLQVA
jgi:hypothetical protein